MTDFFVVGQKWSLTEGVVRSPMRARRFRHPLPWHAQFVQLRWECAVMHLHACRCAVVTSQEHVLEDKQEQQGLAAVRAGARARGAFLSLG